MSRVDSALQAAQRRGRPLSVPPAALPRGSYLVKRTADYLLAGFGVLAGLVFFVPIATLIKLDSPGPVFFVQERVGRSGRRFQVFKFRTMYDGVSEDLHREFVRQQVFQVPGPASQGNGNGNGNGNGDGGPSPVYKLLSDHRVTRVGRFLRRMSLDELPQLINVLRGEMSLVGPRPPLPYELEDYEPWQFERLSVMPGLTGLWQVSGRALLTYRQMCEVDVKYVRGWSLWLDLRILVKTVPVVLFHADWTA